MHPFWCTAQYRKHPEDYPDASLGKYLEGAKAKGLTEAEILMDMHQAVCVGAYGGVTSVVGALPHQHCLYRGAPHLTCLMFPRCQSTGVYPAKCASSLRGC